MKRNVSLGAIAAAAMLAFVFAGCQPAAGGGSKNSTVTVTDDEGNEISVVKTGETKSADITTQDFGAVLAWNNEEKSYATSSKIEFEELPKKGDELEVEVEFTISASDVESVKGRFLITDENGKIYKTDQTKLTVSSTARAAEDSDGVTVKGYKQLVVRKSALKKWKGIKFWETYQDSEVITVDFEPDQISNPILISVDGVGQSLVKNVIDIAYYLESLARQMPMIVFKSANIMVATLGNQDRGEYKLDDESRDYIANELSNYHNKGVVTLPYGIELESVGNPVLPKVEDYIKSLKAMLYEGLVTPESLYSSESSNRSTAQIQLTDSSTGHVLFIQFCQEFLKEWVERTLIDPELKKHGKEEGSAYLTFQVTDADLDTNFLQTDDGHNTYITESGRKSTALTVDDDPYETQKGND